MGGLKSEGPAAAKAHIGAVGVQRASIPGTSHSARLAAQAEGQKGAGQQGVILGAFIILGDGFFEKFPGLAVTAGHLRHGAEQVQGMAMVGLRLQDLAAQFAGAIQIPLLESFLRLLLQLTQFFWADVYCVLSTLFSRAVTAPRASRNAAVRANIP